MQIKDFYRNIGEDYDDVKFRLLDDCRVKKYLKIFAEDKNYFNLCSAIDSENYEQAFRLAHTFKSTAATLGFSNLSKASSALTEVLRNNSRPNREEVNNLKKEISLSYRSVISNLKYLE